MPNVEIHGLLDLDARRKRDQIFEKFRETCFVCHMVVTIFPTEVFNFKLERQPFFRLLNSGDSGEEKIIIPGLLELGLDVEYVKLQDFYPKEL